MDALKFRTLLSIDDLASSQLLADDAAEGPALLAAMTALDEHRRRGQVAETPAKNQHGSRRWELSAASGELVGYLYVEPTCNAALADPQWLTAGGYPATRGWWRDSNDGHLTLVY